MPFTTGVDTIIKAIKYILICFLILSCAANKNRLPGKFERKPEVHILTQHWNSADDSLNLYLFIELPFSHLVFKKSTDHFYSEVTYTLVVSDSDNNTKLFRQTWDEVITEPYYENTRDPDNYFNTEKNIMLKPGNYKVFLNIQDQDNRENMRIEKEYKLEKVNYLSPALPFVKAEEGYLSVMQFIKEKTDTVWLRTQVNFPDTANPKIEYFISRKESVIDSGSVPISGTTDQNLHYLPVPITNHSKDRYTIKLSYMDENQEVTINYGYKTKQYWTDDINEVVGVMGYILPTYSEYKQLKQMDVLEQWKIIDQYWKEKDPDPDTPGNPLLDQLNDRVKFTNKNFSVLMQGWRSDRGKIYIIYGPPQYVDESYQDSKGYTFQKWVYPNGKEFIFIDRTMSGDYTLHQERF